MKAADTLTWARCLDGHTDIGLRPGVTINDAICRLAELEGRLPAANKKSAAPAATGTTH